MKILQATRRPILWLIAALVIALVTLPFTLRDIGPSWSAHLGHGRPGTFTAYSQRCTRGCTWYGTFTGDNGSVRNGVLLGSGGHVNHIGDRVAAVDTGDRAAVYPAGGGTDWFFNTVALALQIAAVIYVPIGYSASCDDDLRSAPRPGDRPGQDEGRNPVSAEVELP